MCSRAIPGNETPKASPKVQRTITKSKVRSANDIAFGFVTKEHITHNELVTATAIKKTIMNKKPLEKIPIKKTNTAPTKRQRTSTAPTASTSKPKVEEKPAPLPSSTTKSAKKPKPSWKRRPLPAHSGVPVPEKMKKLFRLQLQDSNDSL